MSCAQRRQLSWVMILIFVYLGAVVADATTLARLQFYQLVQHSSAIARVRCVRADTRLENREIWTDTVFQVVQRDKGFLPTPIVVRVPGGKFHLTSHVDGVPEFRPGEEVYLFLAGQPGRRFYIVGWTQGTFRIRKDTHTGLETVTQDSAEVHVFDPETRTFTKGGIRNLSMDRFLERLERDRSSGRPGLRVQRNRARRSSTCRCFRRFRLPHSFASISRHQQHRRAMEYGAWHEPADDFYHESNVRGHFERN